MIAYCIERRHEPPVEFVGELIAHASSQRANAARWTDLALYRTIGGTLIAVETGQSIITGEHPRTTVTVCCNYREVVAAFGYGWLAKRLYDSAAIDCAETIA